MCARAATRIEPLPRLVRVAEATISEPLRGVYTLLTIGLSLRVAKAAES